MTVHTTTVSLLFVFILLPLRLVGLDLLSALSSQFSVRTLQEGRSGRCGRLRGRRHSHRHKALRPRPVLLQGRELLPGVGPPALSLGRRDRLEGRLL